MVAKAGVAAALLPETIIIIVNTTNTDETDFFIKEYFDLLKRKTSTVYQTSNLIF